jgi:hypothetical protein
MHFKEVGWTGVNCINLAQHKMQWQTVVNILDFKLLPCFECRMFSFGLFPGICSLNADVLEHSVHSIFIGE